MKKILLLLAISFIPALFCSCEKENEITQDERYEVPSISEYETLIKGVWTMYSCWVKFDDSYFYVYGDKEDYLKNDYVSKLPYKVVNGQQKIFINGNEYRLRFNHRISFYIDCDDKNALYQGWYMKQE